MQFSLSKSIEILERTPHTLAELLSGLSHEWIFTNEGGETWSPFDVMGHLIHGDKTDWMSRADIILSDAADKTFQPFDRFAQFEASKGKAMEQLLQEFAELRQLNIEKLKAYHITDDDLKKTGVHPAFGEVTLAQLLSTWTVHDLDHIAQVVRVMAKQYTTEVGPWTAYLKILKQ